MTDIHTRLDERIPCNVPLRLQVDGIWRPVTLVDVSRTGARLRLPLGALGLGPGLGLTEIAEQLVDRLPKRVPLQFHPERLGMLIMRQATVVRLEIAGGSDDEIEVGCALDTILSPEEGAALGVAIPEGGGSGAGPHGPNAPRSRVTMVEARVPRPGAGRARVARSDDEGMPHVPLLGAIECVDESGCTVRVSAPEVRRITGPHDDVRALTVALCEAYGPEAALELERPQEDVLLRRASIQGVEFVNGHPGELRVGFAFCDDRGDAA